MTERAREAARIAAKDAIKDTIGKPIDATPVLARAAIDAYIAALAETHAIVPREPTAEMISAAIALGVEVVSKDNPKRLTGGFATVYRAMLNAAEQQR